MKRRELIKRIEKQAKIMQLPSVEKREGKKHTLCKVDFITVAIPRHKEIAAGTALQIMKDLTSVFGKEWWKNGED